VIVGVNRYVSGGDEQDVEIHRLDPEAERRQIERVRATRAARDPQAAERTLAAVRAGAADGSVNLLVPIRDALAARCTVGEVCGALRDEWGTYDALLRGNA
jgi:methylmalonyl-CoA mutase N-terminal domain/subunit